MKNTPNADRLAAIVRHVLRAYNVCDRHGDPVPASDEVRIAHDIREWLASGETPATDARTAREILR